VSGNREKIHIDYT